MDLIKKQNQTPVSNGEKAVVVSSDMITAYGHGVDVCWNGIMEGRTAVSSFGRFNTAAFQSDYALIEGLKYHGRDSLVMQMLRSLFNKASSIPKDAALLLATTKGEIDILEKSLLKGMGDPAKCNLNNLLKKVRRLTGIKDRGTIISAACASSTTAVARAAEMIRSGNSDCVLAVACDSITEFVFSGFSSLMALDRSPAKPFDKNRMGLSLGEAAAFALIMSGSRAKKEKRKIIGEISGWGLSDDANHMTGPSRAGGGLALAIKKAMKTAGINGNDIGFISAHGTGTAYNDAMELRAFKKVFSGTKPLYSIKGGAGHTMGAAGLVELIVALRALKEKAVPPTVNLKNVDDDARGWASRRKRKLCDNKKALIVNAGFSGINAALILAR